MCLLLGATGVGKTLLVKRLQTILPRRVEGMGVRRGLGVRGALVASGVGDARAGGGVPGAGSGLRSLLGPARRP